MYAVPLRPEPSDADLALRAGAGDTGAFAALMRRNNSRLFRTARAILKHDADAEDALQDAYVRAYRGLGRLAEAGQVQTWLVRIVVNESLRRLSRRGDGDEAIDEQLPAAGPAPDDAAARSELRRLIETAIEALPEKLRTVVVLRGLSELSVEETAAQLGIPPETVKTRFHRGKQALRESLRRRLGPVLSEAYPFAGARCERLVARVLARLAAIGPPAA